MEIEGKTGFKEGETRDREAKIAVEVLSTEAMAPATVFLSVL